jgi:branched-subunit amino acid aminotransferase/4-amino-4-deoxychorismate lyase
MHYTPHIFFNGTLYLANAPLFSANHRAHKYGDGLFETIRIIKGKPAFIDSHLSRLFLSAKKLVIDIPFNEEQIKEQALLLIQKNDITESGRLRIAAYRSGEGNYRPTLNNADVLIEAYKSDFKDAYELNMPGWVIDIYSHAYKPLHFLSAIKSSNSLLYVMAAQWAKERFLDEALIVNENGHICEGTSTNIFCVKNGIIYTSPLEDGCLPGIMRQKVIAYAEKNNLPIKELSLNEKILLEADEIFLTNAYYGIRWVVAFRNKRYFTKEAKKIVVWLNQDFS